MKKIKDIKMCEILILDIEYLCEIMCDAQSENVIIRSAEYRKNNFIKKCERVSLSKDVIIVMCERFIIVDKNKLNNVNLDKFLYNDKKYKMSAKTYAKKYLYINIC